MNYTSGTISNPRRRTRLNFFSYTNKIIEHTTSLESKLDLPRVEYNEGGDKLTGVIKCMPSQPTTKLEENQTYTRSTQITVEAFGEINKKHTS